MKYSHKEQNRTKIKSKKRTGFLSATHGSLTLFAIEGTDPMAQESRNFLLQLT